VTSYDRAHAIVPFNVTPRSQKPEIVLTMSIDFVVIFMNPFIFVSETHYVLCEVEIKF